MVDFFFSWIGGLSRDALRRRWNVSYGEETHSNFKLISLKDWVETHRYIAQEFIQATI